MLTLSVLQLLTLDFMGLEQQLEELIHKNPKFFKHMPIIIDLQKIYSLEADINFLEINHLLRKNGLVPVGIMNGNAKQITQATEASLGIMPSVKTSAPKSTKKIERSKIITQPVRSGQQIYAKETDLIVLASVSNGAEIIADGNIHVYGTLRGRAIAGASGDLEARIFCHKLEAELIAISGHYKLQEELNNHPLESIQIYLKNEQLIIIALN
jgi:septum site-determining protein MinC